MDGNDIPPAPMDTSTGSDQGDTSAWAPNQDYVHRLFQIESNGDPNAVTGSNRGLGQFGPNEERMYGITDQNRNDPAAQSQAVLNEAAHHGHILESALGRPARPGEYYLTHQQGIGGGPALLTADPNTPAWQVLRRFYGSDAMAMKAISGNTPGNEPLAQVPVMQRTAGAFTKMWVDRFEKGLGNYNGEASSSSSSSAQSTTSGPTAYSRPANALVAPGAAPANVNSPLMQEAESLINPKPPQVRPQLQPRKPAIQQPQQQQIPDIAARLAVALGNRPLVEG